MYGNSALTPLQGVEGVFFSSDQYNPAATLVSPVVGGLRAGPGGAAVGRFGWVDDNGIVRNERLAVTDRLGLIVADIPINSDWRRVFFDTVTGTWRIREGFPITMLRSGNLWVKFRDGAVLAQPVYANVLDGRAISGYSPSGELTPWSVGSTVSAEAMALITTWSTYS